MNFYESEMKSFDSLVEYMPNSKQIEITYYDFNLMKDRYEELRKVVSDKDSYLFPNDKSREKTLETKTLWKVRFLNFENNLRFIFGPSLDELMDYIRENY